MIKRLTALLLAVLMSFSMFNFAVSAEDENEEEVLEKIGTVQEEYVPEKTYFVSKSDQQFVGEDNLDGDKTKGCFAEGTENSHGSFGGVWQSNAFAKYVFNAAFGEVPTYDYHCNPSYLSDNVKLIGRYASKCSHKLIRGEIDGDVTVENIKMLISKAKIGDILVLAPKGRCKFTGTSMVIKEINNAGIKVYQADYTGMCAVTENVIAYDAIAKYHCVSLLHSEKYPLIPAIPPEAVSAVTVSSNDFALNENVSVSWMPVKWATSYKVSLIDTNGNNTVKTVEVENTVASFVFEKPGIFKVNVVAVNKHGDSAAKSSDTITVHNVNVVTFADPDGAVISTQRVQYGGKATAPSVPDKTGYKFSGWDKSLDNITAPTTITATYEIIKYSVQFYDIGGTSLLKEEKVPFGHSATPPTNYTLSAGYVFAGWHVEFDENHQCADYKKVDGDMKLIATECWENDNLPILITLHSAVLQEDGKTYRINATLKNYDKGATSFKVIVTLKTSIGKTVKSVPYKEVTLAANGSVSFNEDIVYSDKITTVELLAVGVKDDVKTTGAYSKLVSCGITAATTWSWGAWTDWTTSNMTGSYDTYETKTQYRSQTTEYTTGSSSPNYSGWTCYNTVPHVGNWSGWQNSAVYYVKNDSLLREVQTRTIPATYKTQYRYGRWQRTDKYWTHFCWELGKSQQGGYWSKVYTDWSDSQRACTSWHKWVCGYNHSSHIGNEGKYWNDYNGYYWEETRQVQLTAAYTQYNYRDTTYTYYFKRTLPWTAWQDAYIGASNNVAVETRTLYRYRNKITSNVSDPNAGLENNSGNEYSFTGVIPETTANLSGKIANLMVYKKTNSDPTEAQLEYVGQITIGSGNTYSIKFRPREEPSVDTGDFIVTLGVEGADNLVNIEVIKAALPTFTVRFLNEDGTMIGEAQSVTKGDSANAPEAPEKAGYSFAKWSDNITNVQSNLEVTPIYTKNQYTVSFIDWENGSVTTEKFYYGDAIQYPVLAPMAHIESRVWDKQAAGVELVSENLVVQTVSTYEKYTVNFKDGETVLLTEEVEYGKAATLPESHPIHEGMVFVDWRGPCARDFITCDADFSPAYIYENSVATPVADMTENADGTVNVSLSCETEGAQIYYIIENKDDVHLSEVDEETIFDNIVKLMSETTGEAVEDLENSIGQADGYNYLGVASLYDGTPITLEKNQTVVYIAAAENMNDSIPASECSTEELYYTEAVTENSLRQYKTTVEGAVTVHLDNVTTAFDFGTFTLAFYTEKGVLIDIVSTEMNLAPGANSIVFDDISVDISCSDVKCKLISWISGSNVKPISDVLEIEVK